MELLVATVCLSVTAIGIITAINFTDTQNFLTRHRAKALVIATSEIEKYKSKAYYGAVAAGVTSTGIPATDLPQPAGLTTTVSATADPKVFTVSAQVSWTVMIASGPATRTTQIDSAVRNDAP